ncbi:peptide ABC transporter substrate-binding protein, partial [Vibrio vulnificus]
DAANKLLDESGYVKGADGVRLDKTGKSLTLRLLGRNTDGTHQQIIDFVTKWLKNIGITVTPEMKSNVQVNDDSILGNVDMYFTGWNIGPDPDYQLSINQCSALPNA